MATGTGIKEREEIKFDFSLPREYNVIIYDDDTTPVEFVILVLVTFFQKKESEVMSIIDTAQTRGKAVVITTSKDTAETKLEEVRNAIADTPFELRFEVEEA